MYLDLRNAPYDDFVEFVFNHVPEEDLDEIWYWKVDLEVEVDPRAVVAYLTTMCKEAGSLLTRFTTRQVTEGFDFLFGAGGRRWFRDQFWNPSIPWNERRACILTIPKLYEQIFEQHDDGGYGFMLWDSLAYDYFCGNRRPDRNAEDARVQDAMFQALERLLLSQNPDTQAAAIHGLGHLCHAASTRAIRDYLASERALDPEVRQYARDVLEGNFQ